MSSLGDGLALAVPPHLARPGEPELYAAAMAVLRLVVWLRRPPERRRAWIPIPFHLVLAAFLFVFGSWHLAGGSG